MFDEVLDGDHRIYVLFFFDSGALGDTGDEELSSELHEHVHHEKEALNDNLEKFDDRVFFAEIDVAMGDFTDALQAFTLSRDALSSYPATIVIDDSEGIWVNGPNEYNVVLQKIEHWLQDPYASGIF